MFACGRVVLAVLLVLACVFVAASAGMGVGVFVAGVLGESRGTRVGFAISGSFVRFEVSTVAI